MKDDSSSEEDFDAEVDFVIRNLRKFMKKKSNRKEVEKTLTLVVTSTTRT